MLDTFHTLHDVSYREAKFSGTHGDRGIFIFPVQLTTTGRIGNLTRLIHPLYIFMMTMHIYTYIGCKYRTTTYMVLTGNFQTSG